MKACELRPGMVVLVRVAQSETKRPTYRPDELRRIKATEYSTKDHLTIYFVGRPPIYLQWDTDLGTHPA